MLIFNVCLDEHEANAKVLSADLIFNKSKNKTQLNREHKYECFSRHNMKTPQQTFNIRQREIQNTGVYLHD